MRKRHIATTIAIAGVVALAGPSAAPAQAVAEDPDIVVLKDSADPAQLAAKHSKKYGFEVVFIYRHALKGYAARLSPSVTNAIERDPPVLFVDDRDVEARRRRPLLRGGNGPRVRSRSRSCPSASTASTPRSAVRARATGRDGSRSTSRCSTAASSETIPT